MGCRESNGQYSGTSCPVIVLKTKGTAGHAPCPARKCLIVVSDGLVEVVPGQCLAAKVVVVDHPPVTFIVPFSPDDRDLVRKELSGFLQEPNSRQSVGTSPPIAIC